VDDARIAAGCMDQPGKLARFRSSLVYDAVMRLPLAIWFAICASAVGQRLYADVAAAPVVDAKLVLDVAARVSGIAFILIIILALSVRLPAIARSAGVLPRVVAFGGTFSLTALALFDPVPHSLPVAIASLVFMCVGYAFACYTLVHLGRSLSMMAEARKLVTSGPYAIVRHPLYAAEAIASFGLLLQYLSIETVALWLFHLALQLWRITYEEKILCQTFPEYADYSLRVSRLLPST
jgi:protein-S-isoprenylcysteine O-methyltransferase Ste14